MPKTEGLQGYDLIGIEGELRGLENGGVLGLLWPNDRHIEERSSPGDEEHQVILGCDLDHLRLERYEQLRKGEPARLWLSLWPRIVRGSTRLRARIPPFSFMVPRDEWLGFLSEVRYGDFDIVELRRPMRDLESFRDVREQLDIARTRIDRGEYNTALLACRTALEQVIQAIRAENDQKPLKDILVSFTDAERGEMYASIVTKAKDLCSRAIHHPQTTFTFSRPEAQFIVRTAENAIALLGQCRTTSSGSGTN